MKTGASALAILFAALPAFAAPPVSDAALAGLLTARRFDQIDSLWRERGTDAEERTPMRMTLFCAAEIYRGDWSAALDCLDGFDKVIAAGNRETRYGTVRIAWSAKPSYMRAEVLLGLGDYAGAEAAALKALAAAESDGPQVQQGADRMLSLQGLALARAFSGRKEEALQTAARMDAAAALDSAAKEAALGPMLRLGKARVFAAAGEWAKAASELARRDASLNTFVAQAVDQDYLKLGMDYVKARAALEDGRPAEAARQFAALIANPKLAASGDLLWPTRLGAGQAALALGRRGEAIGHLLAAADAVERQRKTVNTEAARIGFAGSKQEVYAALVQALIAENRPLDALEAAERAKARALVDLLAGSELKPKPAAPPAARAMLDEIRRSDRDAASIVPDDPEQARRGMARIRETLAAADPGLAVLVSAALPPRAADFLPLLEDGEILVDYWGYGTDLWAFVAGRDGRVSAVRIEAGADAAAVMAFRKAVEGGDDAAVARLGAELYGRLIEPLGLPDGARLVLVPHGALHYLPFAALRDSQGRWLIESHRLRLLPAASAMPLIGRGGRNPVQSIIVFGDPDLGDVRYDLPGAEAEAKAVAAAWPGAVLLLRGAANRQAFESEAGKFRIVHYAGHGQYNPADPLSSRLLLSGSSPDAGQLTAREIYGIGLEADLAILSACETGLARIGNGDDAVGLERGFFRAGAKAILSSLWEISDESSKDIMLGVHAGLRAGKPPADALRDAQLAAMKRWPQPVHWAAFKLSGND